MSQKREIATLAGGCFWCTEAVFKELKGVEHVESGYAGGTVPNPTYEQVCTGRTGHAEAVQVTFDPSIISYEELLKIFFTVHDPTTLNRQGADVGTQYRSAMPGAKVMPIEPRPEPESTASIHSGCNSLVLIIIFRDL